MKLYPKYALFTLVATVLVILWGAYVRATGSGAGCGAHWPLCNGVILPETEAHKTWVEYFHRVTSGLLLLMVLALFGWAWKVYPAGGFAFRAAALSLVAVLLEALVGAFLVLLKLVEHDQSVLRVVSISLHLVNTLFLLASLTCAAFAPRIANPRWRWPDPATVWWPRALMLGFAVLGAMGAVAALGDTLFPPSSVVGGLMADLSGRGHVAERIRVFHPLFAVGWVGAFAYWGADLWGRFPELKKHGLGTLGLAALNLALGLLNILLLAPVWMQILHLLVADLLWIVFITLLFRAASSPGWNRGLNSGIT